MSESTGRIVFGSLFFVIFIAGIHVVSDWRLDDVTLASAPIVLSAEAFVFAMLYLTIFHSHVE